MIDADIRGKLRPDGSNAHIRSEDLLTSTVFGLLRYLHVSQVMLPLMCRVRSATLIDGKLAIAQPSSCGTPWMDLQNAVSCDIELWPSFGRFGQPDILLTFRNATGNVIHLTVIEAKLHSPKSGAFDAYEDDEMDVAADADLIEEEIDTAADEALLFDQLGKYWQGVIAYDQSPGAAHCSVVYLTGHATPPVDDLSESLRTCPVMRLGWISWSDIWHATVPLATQLNTPAWDLTRLLAKRGFKALDAFKSVVPKLPRSGKFWQHRHWFGGTTVPQFTKQRFWEAL